MRAVLLRPKALSDLDAIWSYTEDTWSTDQAVRYLSGLVGALTLLSEFPEIARLRDEFTPPIRAHRYRAHVILYTTDDTTLDVIRIVHARSNWAGYLAE